MSKTICCLAFFVGFTNSLVGEQPIFVSTWGEFGTGNGQFMGLNDAALDSNGNIYVPDMNNHRIQKFDRDGNYLDQWGTFGSGNGQFNGPTGIALDSAGNVYVVDRGNNRVQKFDSAGVYLAQWGSLGSGDGQFSEPQKIAADSAGNVFVTDGQNFRIQKFTDSGTYLTQWGSVGNGNGQFASLRGISVDDSGNVYVPDGINRIQKFTGSGIYLDQWGSSGSGDGQFNGPDGVKFEPSGIVYVTDRGNDRIQKFTTSGVYLDQWSTLIIGSVPNSPRGVAISPKGDVYVIHNNDFIQRWFDLDALQPGETAEFPELTIFSDPDLGNALTLTTDKNVTVSTTTTVQLGASLTLAGGSLTTQTLLSIGQINLDSGSLTVTGLTGLTIGLGGQVPSFTLASGQTLDVTHQTTVVTGGSLAVTDGTFSTDTLQVAGGTVTASNLNGVSNLHVETGTVSLSGNSNPVRVTGNIAGLITVNDNLSLGDGTLFDGFNYQGTLAVGPHNVSLQSAGFSSLGVLTTVGGGTLSAVNGLAFGVGNNLQGTGNINAKIAQAVGSTIVASGNLTIGDSNSFAGFFADGEMQINNYTVTLHDRDKAVLGSLTEIGSGGADGVLSAPNGILLEDGKTLVGQGEVNTSNDEFKNQGFVQGDGMGITFNHLVTGGGDFGGTVTFAGGFSPGNSPALVELENVNFGSANVLTIELGGVDRGMEYDALDVSGMAVVDGTFNVELIDGFVPSLGDMFEVITFGSRSGDFSYSGLHLDNGLTFAPSITENSLLLAVVPEPILLLEVNTKKPFNVTLKGDLGQDVVINSYQITSAVGSLDPTGWNSLADQDFEGDYDGNGTIDGADVLKWQIDGGTPAQLAEWEAHYGNSGPGSGWEEGVVSANFLGESFLLGDSTIAAGASIDLGVIFDQQPGNPALSEDWVFSFRTADGTILPGIVTYVSAVAAASAVPEPTTSALALAALCLAMSRRRAF
ncbi:MAG: hypothetical protein IH831_05070 [Planctomycetes bacterium]|nr:hypothetical protein [Planctomycetota bacterium]